MKINTHNGKFQPVSIEIETLAEARALYLALNGTTLAEDRVAFRKRFREEYPCETIAAMADLYGFLDGVINLDPG